MPEIYKTNIRGSLEDSLSRVKQAILPAVILEDSLAGWVMDFDALRAETPPSESRRSESRDNRSQFVLMTAIGVALQQQMPLYFALLFCIGRQWRVSEIAIESLQSASGRENVLSSVRATKSNLSKLKGRPAAALLETSTKSFIEAFQSILDLGLEHHRSQLRQAENWWRAWQAEVEPVKQAVDSCIANAGERNDDSTFRGAMQAILKVYQPSPLQLSLEHAGIIFKATTQGSSSGQNLTTEPLTLMLLAALTSGRRSGYPDFRDIERFIYYWSEALTTAPRVQIVLEHLKRKYGVENPFDKYQPMINSATEELRKLVLENELPGGDDSPWLQVWKKTLDEEPSGYVELRSRDLKSHAVLHSFARSADSTIKHYIDHPIRPGELWDEFIQRLFDYSWITPIVRQMAKANKEAQPEEMPWTFISFVDLLKGVVSQLTSISYSLTVPQEKRCKLVWEDAHGEKGLGHQDEW